VSDESFHFTGSSTSSRSKLHPQPELEPPGIVLPEYPAKVRIQYAGIRIVPILHIERAVGFHTEADPYSLHLKAAAQRQVPEFARGTR
jgi:hypothetical protein